MLMLNHPLKIKLKKTHCLMLILYMLNKWKQNEVLWVCTSDMIYDMLMAVSVCVSWTFTAVRKHNSNKPYNIHVLSNVQYSINIVDVMNELYICTKLIIIKSKDYTNFSVVGSFLRPLLQQAITPCKKLVVRLRETRLVYTISIKFS